MGCDRFALHLQSLVVHLVSVVHLVMVVHLVRFIYYAVRGRGLADHSHAISGCHAIS